MGVCRILRLGNSYTFFGDSSIMDFWEFTGADTKLQILNWRQVFRIGFTYIGVILIALFMYYGLNSLGDLVVESSVDVCLEESSFTSGSCWYVDISMGIQTILNLAAQAIALAALIGVAIKGYSDAKSASRFLENKTDESFVLERRDGGGKPFVQSKPVASKGKVRPPPRS